MQRINYYIARLRGLLLSLHSLTGINFRLCIYKNFTITRERIKFGRNVSIYYNSRIEAITLYEGIKFNPIIELCNNVSIQQNIHLTCANNVYIGKNTAIAANVTITDIHHPYTDINKPIEKQNIEVGYVRIGEDCKIYNNAVILPNVTIGKHVTIGANSVVNKSIPDYCVVVGHPAHIIKRYDFTTKTWRKTNHKGDFIE